MAAMRDKQEREGWNGIRPYPVQGFEARILRGILPPPIASPVQYWAVTATVPWSPSSRMTSRVLSKPLQFLPLTVTRWIGAALGCRKRNDTNPGGLREGNSTVAYSPWLQGPCSRIWTRITRNRGTLPHEVLFHELVHALRDAAGHGNSLSPLSGGLRGYDNTEELIAVVVTNIYMTDPTNKKADRVGLRRDHGFGTLNPALSDSLEFFASSQDSYNRIDQFCREDAWFTQKLAETKAAFNPIAVYYHDQAAARNKSASASAMFRDVWPRAAS